ncbi:hypothetical protein BFL34_01421 [Clavibacter michiganensis]|uniref:Uncharacterized protein n=1 Tax=Clavibacter michiganensis TaxID=28447 RepID=A0A251Y930_9MICO|nr:hypothetical protein [Clavibacter michiganensis]OUE20603.1 hypothetical protein BFL34_01421 [Clavibacter michiganensis]
MPHRIARPTTARAALAVGALAGALVLVPTVAQAAPAVSHGTSATSAAAHGSVDPATSLRRGDGCIWGPPGDIGAAADRARSDDGSSTPPRIHC